jgi:hypothetical protein
MDAVKLHAVAAFAVGLIITLFLAAYLTPRTWWRRPNARALLIMVAGAWGFGSLILYAAHGPAAAAAAKPAPSLQAAMEPAPATVPAADSEPAAGQPFRVHRDLNLRSAPGVHAARIATVPAGAEVTPTGLHDGDWWQIQARFNGGTSTGWVSSLWLRRSGE